MRSPNDWEGRKSASGTDLDIPCSAIGNQSEYRACPAYEALKGVKPDASKR